MRCNNCNKNIDSDSKFCPSCGEKVEIKEKTKATELDKSIIEHLEFLGYETNLINEETQQYSAKHKNRTNLIFNPVTELGISFVTFYTLDEEKVRKNYKNALEIINRMNNKALFCSFSISPSLETFVCGSFYLGKYNKKQFADFLDLYDRDLETRLKEENYLSNIS